MYSQGSNITIKIVLDTRRKKQDGTYPLKLRVSYRRIQKYFQTGLSYKEHEYKAILKARSGEKFLTRQEWDKIRMNAVAIAESMEEFTHDRFRFLYLRPPGDHTDVYYRLQQRINELEAEEKWSSRDIYKYALASFEEFCASQSKPYEENGTLPFRNVSVDFLKQYRTWFEKKGGSVSTAAMNLRSLRAVFNDAIRTDDIPKTVYPFGKAKDGRYPIPEASNPKRALKPEYLERLFNYETEHPQERFYLDLWLFSYLCYGMNIVDICLLKHKDRVSENEINYYRQKTAHHENKELIRVKLSDPAKEILKQHGTEALYKTDYIFPILEPRLTSQEIRRRYKNCNERVNHYVNQVAHKLGIPGRLSSYTARHSFASMLNEKKHSINTISKLLNHSSLEMTQKYLGDITDEEYLEVNKDLTNFSK
jgi:integrase/recombinase XerD